MNEFQTDGASMDVIECIVAAGYDSVMCCGGKLTHSQQVPVALSGHFVLDV